MELCKRFLRRTVLLLAVLTALVIAAAAADYTADNADAFYKALETALKAQKDNFSIAYTGDRAELGLPDDRALGNPLRTMSARSADGPDNADYPALNVEDGQMGYLDGAYYFDIDYLATHQSESKSYDYFPSLNGDGKIIASYATYPMDLSFDYIQNELGGVIDADDFASGQGGFSPYQ